MLYHQDFVRHLALAEEIRTAEVRKRNLHLVHFLEVRRIIISRRNRPDLVVSSSHEYIRNLVHSPWKAILLCYVVVGNTKKLTTNQPTLTQPPVGFDSVRSIL